MICEKCGKDKPDVEERENPYVKELYDKVSIEDICDRCYHELLMDI